VALADTDVKAGRSAGPRTLFLRRGFAGVSAAAPARQAELSKETPTPPPRTRRPALPGRLPRVDRNENASDMPVVIRFMPRRVIRAPGFLRLDIIRELLAG